MGGDARAHVREILRPARLPHGGARGVAGQVAASRAPRSRSAAFTPTGTAHRERACTAWCANRRSTRPRAATPPSPTVFVYPEVEREHRGRDSIPPIFLRSTPTAHRAPAASTSTKTDSAVRISHCPAHRLVSAQIDGCVSNRNPRGAMATAERAHSGTASSTMPLGKLSDAHRESVC